MAVLSPSCGTRDPHFGMFSWGMQDPFSCSMQTRVCGMQTRSCGMHVGSSSLTRDQTRGLLHWECGFLLTGPPRKSYLCILITISLKKFLKLGNVSSPTLFFYFKIVLAIQGLQFHINFSIGFSISVKDTFGTLTGIALNL